MQISDKISAIEKELDLQRFRYRGENVWPIIRIGIYLSSTKKTSDATFSYWNALKFLLGGAVGFLSQKIVSLVSAKTVDAVIVTTSHYKVKENNKTFDRIIDPILNFLSTRKKRFSVWEFTAKYRYDDHISYEDHLRPFQKELYFLTFLRKLNPVRTKYKLEGDVVKLNQLLKQYDIQFKVDGGMVRKLETIFFQASVFQKNLAAQKVRNVFVVCYYDIKCFSILLAGKRLNVPVVDLQHGVQGKNHMAYARWPKEVAAHSPFLPTNFFVWDENSRQTILSWKKEAANVLLGCNKWFLDRAKKVADDTILLTLQPIDDFFPEYVVNIIKEYKGDKQWAVRLHPRQVADMGKVEELLEQAGVAHRAEVKNATAKPLTEVLARTALHVTYYSSVAIEASYFNIPTYFLERSYLVHYADYLSDDLIYCYPEDNFNAVVERISREGFSAGNEGSERINVLDQFIHA